MPNKTILTVLADNKELFEAVMVAVVEEFMTDEVVSTMTNEQMGAITRARVEGIKKVEKAFLKIASKKSTVELAKKENPAY